MEKQAIDTVSLDRIFAARGKVAKCEAEEDAAADAHKEAKKATEVAWRELAQEIDELNQPNMFNAKDEDQE